MDVKNDKTNQPSSCFAAGYQHIDDKLCLMMYLIKCDSSDLSAPQLGRLLNFYS